MSLNESMSAKERAKLAVWDYPVSDKFTNMWRYMEESKLPETSAEAIKRVLESKDGFAFIGTFFPRKTDVIDARDVCGRFVSCGRG